MRSFLGAWLLAMLLVGVISQRCIEFSDNGFCLLCQIGAHLTNGQCVYNIQNCVEYLDEFTCLGCTYGYTLESKNQCKLEGDDPQVVSADYQILSQLEISTDDNISLMEEILKNQIGMIPATATIHSVYVKAESGTKYYRIIYELGNGYAQITSSFDEGTNKLSFEKQQIYQKKASEQQVRLQQQPNSESIEEQIYHSFPKLQQEELIISWKNIGEDMVYRFLFVSAAEGIKEIQLQITELPSSSSLGFLDIGRIDQVPELQKGYQYLVSSFENRLKGSQLESIAMNQVDGMMYYLIVFKKEEITYEAVYYIEGDEVKISEFTAIHGQFSFPEEGKLSEITLGQFQREPNAGRILTSLIQLNSKELAGSGITIIKYLFTDNTYYYQILLSKADIGYWKFLQLDANNNQITILKEVQMQNRKAIAGQFINIMEFFTLQQENMPENNGNSDNTNSNDSGSGGETDFLGGFESFGFGPGSTSKPQPQQPQPEKQPQPQPQPQPQGQQEKQTEVGGFQSHGGKVTIAEKDYPNDKYLNSIITLIKRFHTERLEYSSLVQVQYEVTTGINYYLHYLRQDGSQLFFHVVVDDGDISVVEVEETEPTPTQPVILSRSEYENDEVFKFVNSRILVLYGQKIGTNIKIQQVERKSSGSMFYYVITYVGSNGIFHIDVQSSADFQFDITNFIKEETQPQPTVLTPEQYNAEKVKKMTDLIQTIYKSRLPNATLHRVTLLEIGNDQQYTIKYSNDENTYTFEVIRRSSGKIQIRNFQTGPRQDFQAVDQPQIQEEVKEEEEAVTPTEEKTPFSPVQPVQPVKPVGTVEGEEEQEQPIEEVEEQKEEYQGPVVLTQAEYTNDPYFTAVNRALQSSNSSLSGYKIIRVLRQSANGYFYTIMYRNSAGGELIYEVSVSLAGKITVENLAQKPAPTPVTSPQTLTQQQYQNDSNFKAVDSMLRTTRQLSGYSVVKVVRLFLNGYMYTITYRNAKGAEMMFVLTVSEDGSNIDIQQETSKPAPVSPTLSQLVTLDSLPAYIRGRLSATDELYSPSSFGARYPSQYEHIMQLVMNIFDGSQILYIFYSPSNGVYWVYTSHHHWVELRALLSGFQLISVQPAPSAPTQSSTINLSQSNLNAVLNFVGSFGLAEIDRVSGRGEYENNGYFITWNIFITLHSGLIYHLQLLGTNKLQPDTLLPISYSIFPRTYPNYLFHDAEVVSGGILEEMKRVFGKLDLVRVLSIEEDANDGNVLRVVFETTDGHVYQTILLDGRVQALKRMDHGYTVVEGSANNQPLYNFIQKYLRTSGEVKLSKSLTLNGYTDYRLIYLTSKAAYHLRVIMESNKFSIDSLITLDSGLYQQHYSYSKFETATLANVEQVKKTRAFKIAESHLLKHYSHFLVSPTITDIFLERDEGKSAIIYNVIYVTRSATFLAILRFNEETETPEIKSLVVAKDNELVPEIENCQQVDSRNNTCIQCNEGYVVGSDGFCFFEVHNCRLHAGNTCYYCEKPYLLRENECISDCGLFCNGEAFTYLTTLLQ